jgi:hypothetical protein
MPLISLQRSLKPLAAILPGQIQSLPVFVIPGVKRYNDKQPNPCLYIQLGKMATGCLLFHSKALRVQILFIYIHVSTLAWGFWGANTSTPFELQIYRKIKKGSLLIPFMYFANWCEIITLWLWF